MRLVVALDGSEQDEALVAPTSMLVREAHAEVVLLNVVDPRADAAHITALSRAEALEQVVATRRAYLERHARQLEAAAEILLVEQLKHGEDVAECLARVAREQKADMLAVATNRASGVRGLILGSVAQQLLRLSPCPVLVVRAN